MKLFSVIQERGSYVGESFIAYHHSDGYRIIALSFFKLTLVAEIWWKKGKPLKTNFYHLWTE